MAAREKHQDEDQGDEITFRRVRDDDLPMLHGWLNEPAVVEWWEGTDVSWPAVVARYGSGGDGRAEHWIASLGSEPFGWIQCYHAADDADGEAYYWQEHIDLERTGGIDYLVSDAVGRGRGFGARMIRTFVRDVVFAQHPEWDYAAAGPFEANAPSVRALEKAGFTCRARMDDKDGPTVLMVAPRNRDT